MAKVNWQDIGEVAAVDAGNIKRSIVIPAKEALRQVRFALSGNLTIRDNQYAAIVTLGYNGNYATTLTHNTEYTFQNPLKTTPLGFVPIRAFDGNGAAVVTPPCIFNPSRTDGLLGITAQFPVAPGQCVSSFVNAASPVSLTGSVVANDITSITIGAGAWDIDFSVQHLANSATGITLVRGWVNTTAGTDPGINANPDQRFVHNAVPAGTAPSLGTIAGYRVSLTSPVVHYLSANMTFSGGTGQAYGRISAVKVAESTSYTANVTGILWGG